MSTGYLYDPLPDVDSGVRLHLNENTDGCSPAVLRAIRRVTREQVAWYPAYASATRACAAWFGVPTDHVLLTNGLDEGILTVALALLGRHGDRMDAVVVEPAYGLYGPSAALAGAHVIRTAPQADLGFSVAAVREAVTPQTRLVLLSNPNNPTGHLIPLDALCEIARLVPPGAVVFLDEAYADFAGSSFIPLLPDHPNVVIGRTFAKAYGLAGLRVGTVVASRELISRLRGAIAPFSVNVFAAAALEAALADRGRLEWYLYQVRQSRELIYAACNRLGLRCWPSEANFVLVRVGDAGAVREALAARGVHVRDRSTAAGCEGCIRVTAGVTDDTRAFVAALEEVVCVARS
jgi:histidinol-phosphate aminotransferase